MEYYYLRKFGNRQSRLSEFARSLRFFLEKKKGKALKICKTIQRSSVLEIGDRNTPVHCVLTTLGMAGAAHTGSGRSLRCTVQIIRSKLPYHRDVLSSYRL